MAPKMSKFDRDQAARIAIAMRVPAVHFPECREKDRPGCLCAAKALGCLQNAYYNACWNLDAISGRPHRKFDGTDK